MHTLLLMTNHRHDHISRLHGLHQHQEWMFSTISIPQRKYCIVIETISLMDVMVQATIFSVYIHVD